MIRDKLLNMFEESGNGLLLENVSEQFDGKDIGVAYAIEAILMMSPEFACEEGRWKLLHKGKSAAILSAIESYADATGKKIFRATAALSNLSPGEQPTEEELREILTKSHGCYELLPNSMIKRRS